MEEKKNICFRMYHYSDLYWQGINIDFTGSNGEQFYNCIKISNINWKIFYHRRGLNLSRLDFYYGLKSNNTIINNMKPFLKKCHDKIIKNCNIQKNTIVKPKNYK